MGRAFRALATAAVAALCAGAPAGATGVRFLVAENPALVAPCVHCDSYVLPLENPADVQLARDIIASGGVNVPGLNTLVVARIAAGADGVNRDHRAPGQPPWSWHVTELVVFAETTIEVLDGWPAFVESDVAGWIQNTNGLVGFWTYTVVEELPEASAPALLGVGAAVLILARRGRHQRA